MKILILTALLATFTTTASATIVCQKVSCKRDPIVNSPYNYCDDFSAFHFEKREKSGFVIGLVSKQGQKSEYDGDYTSASPQQVTGKSEDLFAQFNIDAKSENGQVVMYRRGTSLILADFELRCMGTL